MLNLSTTSTLLRLVTGSASDIEVTRHYVDAPIPAGSSSTFTATGGVMASITTAATTTIVPSPADSTARNVKGLTIYNNHATTANAVTVEMFDGTNAAEIASATLLAQERLVLTENGNFIHLDANNGEYPSVGNAAVQSEMEAGTATDKYVTPQGVNWHPGVCKAWVVAGVTGNNLASWNITSLTDTGTGVLGITIATDFSSVSYCVQATVETPATTWGMANCREVHIRSATLAVGTVSVDCVDNTTTTSLVKDPTTWHVAMFGDQ